MKKLFLLLAILLMGNIAVMAQDSKVSWNVKAGLNLSNWTGGDTESTDAKIGFKVGAGMEYAFDQTWSLQPSLFFTTKGAKDTWEGDTFTTNQIYLELPVNVQARVPVSDNLNVLFAAGPYFAYGIGGKMSGGGYEEDTFGDGNFKKIDAGVGLGVSFEISKIILGLEGQLGLTKLGDGDAPKNINFGLVVGYKF